MRGPNGKKQGGGASGRKSKGERNAPQTPQRDESDIFIDEVNDELQREQLTNLAKTYGPYALGALAVGFAGVVAYEAYQGSVLSARRDSGDQFIKAFQTEAPAAELEALAASSDGDLSALALMRAAASLSDGVGDDDDLARAAELYGIVYQTPDLPPAYADMARIRLALIGSESETPADLLALLQPAAAPGRPYRPLALELIAAAHLRSEGYDEARAALNEALADPLATPSSRQRVGGLLAAIDELAPSPAAEAQPDPETPAPASDG